MFLCCKNSWNLINKINKISRFCDLISNLQIEFSFTISPFRFWANQIQFLPPFCSIDSQKKKSIKEMPLTKKKLIQFRNSIKTVTIFSELKQ